MLKCMWGTLYIFYKCGKMQGKWGGKSGEGVVGEWMGKPLAVQASNELKLI